MKKKIFLLLVILILGFVFMIDSNVKAEDTSDSGGEGEEAEVERSMHVVSSSVSSIAEAPSNDKTYFSSICDTDNKYGKGIGDDSITIGNEDECKGASVTSDYTDVVGKPPEKESYYISYDVVFLLDTSHSMEKDSDKIKNLKNAVKKAIDIMEGYNTGKKTRDGSKTKHRYQICRFGTNIDCDGWKKPEKIKSFKYKVEGDTYTQKAFKKLSSLGLGNNKKRSSMIILITDGYPTYAKNDRNGKEYKMVNLTAPRYYAYTLKTIYNQVKKLKENDENAKFFTFGVMDDHDVVANFFLDPNQQTYGALSNPNSTYKNSDTYGKAIQDVWAGKKVYDAVAGVKAKGDKGSFYGNVEKIGDKYAVVYKIPTNWKNGSETRFFLPTDKDKKADNIYACNSEVKKLKEFSSCTEIKKKSSGKQNQYIYYDITRKGSYLKKYYYFVYNTSSESIFKYYIQSTDFPSISAMQSVGKNKTKLVDDSYVTLKEYTKEMKEYLEKSFEKVITEGTKVTNAGRYWAGSCKVVSGIQYPAGTYYAKFNYTDYITTTYAYDDTGETKTEVTTVEHKDVCGSTEGNITFPLLLREDAKIYEKNSNDMNIYGFNGINTYAGGGYKWPEFTIENRLYASYGKFVYDTSKEEEIGDAVFDNVRVRATTEDGRYITTLSLELDSSLIYKNSNCTGPIGNEEINKIVDKYEKYTESDFGDKANGFKEGLFNTISSNSASEDSNSVLDYKLTYLEDNRLKKFTLTHSKACINGRSGEVTYIGDGESCENSDDEALIDAGRLRYVPLRYPTNNIEINAVGDISSYKDLSINFNAKCNINVKQVLYECPDGADCDKDPSLMQVVYKYRSVDHNNPFPKAGDYNITNNEKIPLNWRNWISNSSNLNRMKDSYNYLNYNYDDNSRSKIIDVDDDSYLDWSNMKADGTSKYIVSDKSGFDVNTHSQYFEFCPLGLATVNGSSCGLGW